MPLQAIKNLFDRPSELNLTLSYNSSFATGVGLLVASLVLVLIWPVPNAPFHIKLTDAIISGLVAAFVYGINISSLPPILPNFFNADRWTVGRDVLFTSWSFFLISVVNMLLLRSLGWMHFEWFHFIGQQLFTFFLGVPPVTMMIIFRNQELARKNLKAAEYLNQQLLTAPKSRYALASGKKMLAKSGNTSNESNVNINTEKAAAASTRKISIQSGQDFISLSIDQILVMQSEKGKLLLYYADEDGNLQYKELNLALGKLEQLTEQYKEHLLRCHRFFWVNMAAIEKVESNARGVQLKIYGIPDPVPVSKTYAAEVNEKFAKMK